jgi:hypothetical protein
MATQLKEDFTEATRWRRRPRPTFAWAAQAVSGVLLLVLLAVHMVASTSWSPAAGAPTPTSSPGSATRRGLGHRPVRPVAAGHDRLALVTR